MNRKTLLACAAAAAFVQPVAAREGGAQALTAIDAACLERTHMLAESFAG
jgi:hypothetical protein